MNVGKSLTRFEQASGDREASSRGQCDLVVSQEFQAGMDGVAWVLGTKMNRLDK